MADVGSGIDCYHPRLMQISLIPRSGQRCLHLSLTGWRLRLAVGVLALMLLLAGLGVVRLLGASLIGDPLAGLSDLWRSGQQSALAAELGSLRARVNQLEATLSSMESQVGPPESEDASAPPPSTRNSASPAEPRSSLDTLVPDLISSAQASGPARTAAQSLDEVYHIHSQLDLLSVRLDQIAVSLSTRPEGLLAQAVVLPAAAEISSGFGRRFDPFNGRLSWHRGIDFRAPAGTPVYSIASGIVESIHPVSGYGNVVKIRHLNDVRSLYAHLQGIEVTTGQAVQPGQRIARIGSTGRSTGNHLHFELIVDGQSVNPLPLLSRAAEPESSLALAD